MQSGSAQLQLIQTHTLHTIKTVLVRADAIGLVISGEKKIRTQHRTSGTFKKGQYFILHRTTQIDIVNKPELNGFYRAKILNFSPSLIDIFNQHYPQFATPSAQKGKHLPEFSPRVVECFLRAVSAIEDVNCSEDVRQHRALELLLLLAEQAIVFLGSAHLSWSDRIFHLLLHLPLDSCDLTSVAAKLFISKCTLQRRLMLESISFSQCLQQVRLDKALALLQGTQQSISAIASQCGYDSHSRFSAAFKTRFGLAPSLIRMRTD